MVINLVSEMRWKYDIFTSPYCPPNTHTHAYIHSQTHSQTQLKEKKVDWWTHLLIYLSTIKWSVDTDFKNAAVGWIPASGVVVNDGISQPDTNDHIPGWIIYLSTRQADNINGMSPV